MYRQRARKRKREKGPRPDRQARLQEKSLRVKAVQLRSTTHARDTVTRDEIHSFVFELQMAELSSGVPQAFQSMLPIRYQDFDVDDEYEEVIVDLCMQFQNGLRKLARTDPFLIPGTGQQACSDECRHFRSIIFTASIAHRVLGLSSIEAKTNFLREHLWLE